MSQLRVTSSILSGGVFDLNGEYFTIGRESDNHIHLDHTSVSKHHAILKIDNGDLKLFDLHSTNGTIVNGELRVVSHLRDGDKILLGEVELRFEANNNATQRLAPAPVIVPRPVPVTPPKPVIPAAAQSPVPVATPKVEPRPTPPPSPPKPIEPAVITPPAPVVTAKVEPPPKELPVEIQDAGAVPARPPEKRAGLMGLFQRSGATETTPEPPASREEIHVELSQRFDTMGLESPKPPPAEKPKTALAAAVEAKKVIAPVPVTTESKPPAITLPPPPKPVDTVLSRPPTAGPVNPIPAAPPQPEPERLLRTPIPAPVPEPPPPIVLNSRMARHRLTCFMSLFAGALLVGLGYLLDAIPLKFFGVLVAMGASISLFFTLRFGNLVAPPRKKPPTT